MRRNRIRITAVVAATLMVLSFSPLGESVASAVAPTAAPTGLTPNGGFVGGNPQLSWNAVGGAAMYRVQIADNPSFSSLIVTKDTYNTTFTHTAELPVGQLYWRVAAKDTGSGIGPWATADVEKGLAAPNTTAPANGAVLDYANMATAFAWTPTAGARAYVLEIDDDNLFVGANRYVTRTTSYTPLLPLAAGKTYYWRVRGASATNGTGVLTNWSEIRSFDQEWSSTANLTSPAYGETVTDLELIWDPVPGARYYNIQVDNSQEFNDPMALKVSNGRNVRVTYPESLNNASYWWRVQAIDSGNNLGSWTEPRLFNRNWIAAPTLVSPAIDANVTGPLRLQWTAVDHAARYVVEAANNEFFSNAKSCITVQTAVYAENCGFSSVTGGAFWWRVRAIDDPQPVDGVWSTKRRVNSYTLEGIATGTFNPGNPVARQLPATRTGTCLTDPAANERAECTYSATPTFTWTPAPGADRYVLRLALDPNFTTVVRTYSVGTQSSFQPLDELPDTDAGQAYYWHVQPCLGGTCGPSPVGQNPVLASSTFMKVSTRVKLLSPTQNSMVADAPRFSWEDYLATTSTDAADPAPGTTNVAAREYQIQVSTVPTFASLIDDATVDQTFYTAYRTYPEGPIYWRVRARDGSKNWLAWSYGTSASDPKAPAYFTKRSPVPTPVSPIGTSQSSSTFRWTRVSGAESYELEVYADGDKGFSPANRVATATTAQFQHTPSKTLPPGAYTWRVRRKDADGRVGAWSHEPNAVGVPLFTVAPSVPTLQSPANNSSTSNNSFVFSWNRVPDAAYYGFQRSTSSNFVTGVSSYDTVMSSYAPTDKWNNGVYWWRVIARDADGKDIGVSTVRKFVKDIQPGVPTTVKAARGNSAAVVTWVAPAPTGGSPITSYSVYPYTGSTQLAPRTAAANATSLLVTGLTNGTEYTFRVTANNPGGPGPLSAKSNAVTPSAGPTLPPGSVYVPVTPCRVVDTRSGGGAFPSNTQRTYQVAGSGSAFNQQGGNSAGCGIPQGAQAVELSVTAVAPEGNGFFRAWPAGQAAPGATFLNYTKGQNVTNTGAVKLTTGPTAQLTVRNYSARSHYVLDVQGYYVDGSSGPVANGTVYVPITPCRLVDTRSGGGPFPSNTQRNFAVTGTGSAFAAQGGKANGCGIPAGAGAIEASVTAVSPASNGFFRAWPAGQGAPAATFLNYTKNQGITNTGAIKVAATGSKQLTARNYSGKANYVIDVQGYFVDVATAPVPPGSVYVPITPCRIVDTRVKGGAFKQNVQRDFAVTGTGSSFAQQGGKGNGCGIPAGATAVEASVTAVAPEGNGFFRAWPTGQAMPSATFLNYTKNRGITNTGAIKLAGSGSKQLTVRNYSATTHYVIDLQGYFLS